MMSFILKCPPHPPIAHHFYPFNSIFTGNLLQSLFAMDDDSDDEEGVHGTSCSNQTTLSTVELD